MTGPADSKATVGTERAQFLARARALAAERDCQNYIGGKFVFCLGHGPCKCMEDARGTK